MSQQQQQQQSSSDSSSGFKEKREVAKSQERNIETVTLDIENTIKKYKITETSDIKKIKNLLALEILNEKLETLIKEGSVKKNEDGYSFGQYKNCTKDEIIKFLSSQNVDMLKRNVEKKYENIQIYFQMKQKNIRNEEMKQQVSDIRQSTANLLVKREQLVSKLEQKNNELLQTAYKQSKLESQMRTELSQQQFQQQNIGVKYEQLKQGLQGQVLQKEAQIAQREEQIQTAISQQMQNKNNFNTLQQQFEATKLKHKDAEQQKQVLEQQKRLLERSNQIASQTLQQTRELRQDINNNFRDMTNLVNDLGKAQIDAIQKASQQTQEEIKQSAIQNKAGQEAIISAINENASQLSSLNQNFNNLNNSLDNLNASVQNLSKDITKMGEKVPPPPPGVPPGCNPAILQSLNCGDGVNAAWDLNPKYQNIQNKQSGQTGINIFICKAGGHFCASDGNYGYYNGAEYNFTRKFIKEMDIFNRPKSYYNYGY